MLKNRQNQPLSLSIDEQQDVKKYKFDLIQNNGIESDEFLLGDDGQENEKDEIPFSSPIKQQHHQTEDRDNNNHLSSSSPSSFAELKSPITIPQSSTTSSSSFRTHTSTMSHTKAGCDSLFEDLNHSLNLTAVF